MRLTLFVKVIARYARDILWGTAQTTRNQSIGQYLGDTIPRWEAGLLIPSLDRKVSQQTRWEVAGLENVALVDMERGFSSNLIASVDAVIMGGGPLEEIGQTEYVWRMFVEANRRRKARVVFGCGIGPLFTDRLRRMVGGICQMATAGFLRDRESYEFALQLDASVSLGCACDPALAYMRRWQRGAPQISGQISPLSIVAMLRANTREYIRDMTPTELKMANAQTARLVAAMLNRVCEKAPAKVDLLPMHSLWVGGDDRMFNREVAEAFGNPDSVRVEQQQTDDLIRELHGTYNDVFGPPSIVEHMSSC